MYIGTASRTNKRKGNLFWSRLLDAFKAEEQNFCYVLLQLFLYMRFASPVFWDIYDRIYVYRIGVFFFSHMNSCSIVMHSEI